MKIQQFHVRIVSQIPKGAGHIIFIPVNLKGFPGIAVMTGQDHRIPDIPEFIMDHVIFSEVAVRSVFIFLAGEIMRNPKIH